MSTERKKRRRPTDPRQFLRSQLEGLIRQAVESYKDKVCGLLLDNGALLEILPLKNVSKNAGSFQLPMETVRQRQDVAPRLGHRVVGTYHSHPFSEAIPGESDIAGAEEGALMLIVSCWKKEARLWLIRKGQAKELVYSQVELTSA